MTGRQYTYEMVYGLSTRFGSALLRMGAERGDVLGMVVPNIPEFPIAFFGACGVGVTLTTMNPTYRPEEIARQLENSQASFVITIGMFLPNIRQACELYKGVKKIIVIGMEQTPDDCVSFMHMLLGDDGSLYDKVGKIILSSPVSAGHFPFLVPERQDGRPQRGGGAALLLRDDRPAKGGGAHPLQHGGQHVPDHAP